MRKHLAWSNHAISEATQNRNLVLTQTAKTLLLMLAIVLMTPMVQAAAPIGQTIWLKAAANGRYVSSDLNRASYAPLVADRTTVGGREQFQVVDGGGGYIALKALANGMYVAADLNRGSYAPLVADRATVNEWERFAWIELAGGNIALRGKTTGKYVAADLGRASYAPLVSDRTTINTWEMFSWASVNGDGWRLVWSDEFSGSNINRSNWTFDIGGHGWGNNELEHYTDRTQNARVANGNLIIEARRENYGGNSYTSARMKTLASWTYGKIEARIKLPYGQGIWPAFWMLGSNIGTVGWPACGEIDVMEMIGGGGRENTVYGTIHWDFNGHASYTGSNTGPYFPNDYHTFTVEWDTQEIRWYVDGNRYHVANITINGTEEFHRPFFIILNLAVGGNWPGYPDSSTVFPQQMNVDWVRVYQK